MDITLLNKVKEYAHIIHYDESRTLKESLKSSIWALFDDVQIDELGNLIMRNRSRNCTFLVSGYDRYEVHPIKYNLDVLKVFTYSNDEYTFLLEKNT